MVVGIIILLKLNGVKAISDKRRGGRKFLDEVLKVSAFGFSDKSATCSIHKGEFGMIEFTSGLILDWVILIDLNLHPTPGCELRNDNVVCDLLEYSRIGLASQSIVEGMQVCSSNDEGEMC